FTGMVMTNFLNALALALIRHLAGIQCLRSCLEDVVIRPRRLLNKDLLIGVPFGDSLQDSAGVFARCHTRIMSKADRVGNVEVVVMLLIGRGAKSRVPISCRPVKNPKLALLGQEIRQLREAKNLSQEEFAGFATIDRAYYGGIERGERNVAALN